MCDDGVRAKEPDVLQLDSEAVSAFSTKLGFWQYVVNLMDKSVSLQQRPVSHSESLVSAFTYEGIQAWTSVLMKSFRTSTSFSSISSMVHSPPATMVMMVNGRRIVTWTCWESSPSLFSSDSWIHGLVSAE